MDFSEAKPTSYPTNLSWTKRKCYCSTSDLPLVDVIHDMTVRDDDVWVVTLPKCGTTWMQELVWLIMNDFDFERAKSEHLEERSPFLAFDFFVNHNVATCLKSVDELKSPRLIKTHRPLPLLPAQLWSKKPKVIYVYRNPKDYLVSLYHHNRSFGDCLDESLEEFIMKRIEKNPIENSSFDHVTEFYALRHEPWVYYASFERMKSNLDEVIRDVCNFLNKSISEEQMLKMLKHLSFEEMKRNPKTNHLWEYQQLGIIHKESTAESHNFVRKGKVGAYKEELSAECIAKLDAWIKEKLSHYNVALNDLLLLK